MDNRKWTPEIVAIGDQIVALSVLQAAQLVEYLDKVHGVQASTVTAKSLVPIPDVVIPQPLLEPTEFDVILQSYEAAKKIGIIKVVRENTSLGLKDARDLVDAIPKVVKERLPRADADKLKASLEAAGAKVKLKPVVE